MIHIHNTEISNSETPGDTGRRVTGIRRDQQGLWRAFVGTETLGHVSPELLRFTADALELLMLSHGDE